MKEKTDWDCRLDTTLILIEIQAVAQYEIIRQRHIEQRHISVKIIIRNFVVTNTNFRVSGWCRRNSTNLYIQKHQ